MSSSVINVCLLAVSKVTGPRYLYANSECDQSVWTNFVFTKLICQNKVGFSSLFIRQTCFCDVLSKNTDHTYLFPFSVYVFKENRLFRKGNNFVKDVFASFCQ